MSELVERAKAFAPVAHEGQTRKNRAQTPLVVHLEEVASLVEQSGGSEIEIAAAWLHDAAEETHWGIQEIQDEFGEEVARIVYGLTDPPQFALLNIYDRKKAQAHRVAGESNSVKRVKLADQISNVRSVAYDPPVRWSTQDRLNYAGGAREIVLQCLGISVFLEDEFFKAYEAARSVYTPR